MSEYEERNLNGYNISEFLKHTTPCLIAEKFTTSSGAGMYPSTTRKIAAGEITTTMDWEEYTYDGKWTPSAIASWLAAFNDGWEVCATYDGELVVTKGTERVLTAEEIAAAKQWVEEHKDLEDKYIKFRTPPVLNPEWFKEDE